ncbi:MAG: Lrp/AsnC ligand binding domain-containing protein [Micrococcales bacterium]|nr:Lrp/AsnC ligand binding domain-containing protein [Micrococcales bacterium]
MVQAYVLIQTEVGKAHDVAQAISGMAGVTGAENVTGPYDVIARVEAETMDELGRLVVSNMGGASGITRTLVCTVVNI